MIHLRLEPTTSNQLVIFDDIFQSLNIIVYMLGSLNSSKRFHISPSQWWRLWIQSSSQCGPGWPPPIYKYVWHEPLYTFLVPYLTTYIYSRGLNHDLSCLHTPVLSCMESWSHFGCRGGSCQIGNGRLD